MKTLLTSLVAVALVVPAAVRAAEPTNPEAQATYAEARKMLGTVPAALRLTPEQSAPAIWNELKALELNPSTSVSGKNKELIGLGVAAQIPCAFCVYFHQEAAKLNGATEKDLREAVAVAAEVRHWATVADTQPTNVKTPAPSKDLEATYADIKATMGSVPDYMYRFPQVGLAPAWQMFKVTMMGDGGIAPKDRALIGVAVSAQLPSVPCINAYTDIAKKLGATDAEVQEAIAMAAITRAGSTVLNGASLDLPAFKKEVDGIIKFVKKEMGHKVAER